MKCVLVLMLVAHLISEKKQQRIINHRIMTVGALKTHLIALLS